MSYSREGPAPKGFGPSVGLTRGHADEEGSMMTLFMIGLGAALVVMIVGIGLAISKDIRELIDFRYDPSDPTNGARRI